MAKSNEEQKMYSRVCDFYDGKSIFITGAGGFVGGILLEILLRCFPGIRNIYILLRPKGDVDPESRKKLIFQKQNFRILLETNPEAIDKVHVIPGDVTEPNLGISDENLAKFTRNVSIVFHCAAIVSFFKPLRHTILPNSVGTKRIIDLCRKLQKLDVLVYTSTAYSNCNYLPDIEETIYKMPFTPERFLYEFENGKEGEFERLKSKCKPEWPNLYTFSKCLSENILNDMASDLPVAIVRPSIVGSTYKAPYDYVEDGAGLFNFSVAVGKGFARVVHCNPNAIFDLVPVDVVANTHIVAAWSVATQRSSSPLVINCTAGHILKLTISQYCEVAMNLAKTHMLPKSFQEPSVKIVTNKYLYRMYALYEHYLPAYVLDMVFAITGNKIRLVPLYVFFDRMMEVALFFLSNSFNFKTENFNALTEQLDPKDKEIFFLDMKDLNFEEIVYRLPKHAKFYDWSIDKKTPEERKRIVYKRTLLIKGIRIFSLMLLCLLIYIILFKLF